MVSTILSQPAAPPQPPQTGSGTPAPAAPPITNTGIFRCFSPTAFTRFHHGAKLVSGTCGCVYHVAELAEKARPWGADRIAPCGHYHDSVASDGRAITRPVAPMLSEDEARRDVRGTDVQRWIDTVRGALCQMDADQLTGRFGIPFWEKTDFAAKTPAGASFLMICATWDEREAAGWLDGEIQDLLSRMPAAPEFECGGEL